MWTIMKSSKLLKGRECQTWPTCTFWYVVDRRAIIMFTRRMTHTIINIAYSVHVRLSEISSAESNLSRSASPKRDQDKCLNVPHQLNKDMTKMNDWKLENMWSRKRKEKEKKKKRKEKKLHVILDMRNMRENNSDEYMADKWQSNKVCQRRVECQFYIHSKIIIPVTNALF